LRVELRFDRPIGRNSRMRQTIRLDAGSRRLEFRCEVDWHETERILKVAFPCNVRTERATYEMQFGVAERPTHFNTAADLAKFEVPAHRWADLSEPGFGVALLNDCKYGYAAADNLITLSLLRGARHPGGDDQIFGDQGRHTFAYAVCPHAGDWRRGGVVAEAWSFNVPLRTLRPCPDLVEMLPQGVPFFSAIDSNLIIDTIKKAEDSDEVVLRLYEPEGDRGRAIIEAASSAIGARNRSNILEDRLGKLKSEDPHSVTVEYRPFEIQTLLLEIS
jgi:alpha-mannosidase